MFYMHGLGWGWWTVMSIGMLAFWVLVIYGIAWLMRTGPNIQQRDQPTPDAPEEILKRRLARGEISSEEYRQLLETLNDEASEHPSAV